MDAEFNKQFREYFDTMEQASEFFGKTTKTMGRWLTGKPCPTAKKLLDIAYRGYLPQNGPWKNCTINDEGNVVTPWGVCRPSDLAFVHHYKNHTRLQTKVLQKYRQSGKDLADLIDEMKTVMDKLSSHQKGLKAL